MGANVKEIVFPGRTFTVMSIPWGDLSTAPVVAKIFRFRGLRKSIQFLVKTFISGPGESLRTTGKAFIYGKVINSKGDIKGAWLETIEVCKFTAIAGVMCVEKVREKRPSGAFTPSIAFGSDFVLEIGGTKRYGMPPGS